MSTSTKKQTPSRRKRRASHFALKKTQLSVCSKCKKPILPHHVCRFCGTYKDKEAIKIRPGKEERKVLKAKKSKETKKTTK
ncbi:MAG: 50S ribosomal protein L32 [bacterium]